MAKLEPQIRAFCAEVLDPLVGAGRFDFVRDLGAIVPMQVIGMLLGIPEQDRQAIRERADARLRTEQGRPMEYDGEGVRQGFDAYVERCIANPADDIISQLVQAEFDDGAGGQRRLDRDELATMIGFLASAGNETTNRLIGWAGKLLAEHPDQLARDPRGSRPDPAGHRGMPALRAARRAHRPLCRQGRRSPRHAGARRLGDGFPHRRRQPRSRASSPIPTASISVREPRPHLTFGYGHHVCLGNALARAEGRIVLDEVLNRFAGWEVDPGQGAAGFGIDRAGVGDIAGEGRWLKSRKYENASEWPPEAPRDSLIASSVCCDVRPMPDASHA